MNPKVPEIMCRSFESEKTRRQPASLVRNTLTLPSLPGIQNGTSSLFFTNVPTSPLRDRSTSHDRLPHPPSQQNLSGLKLTRRGLPHTPMKTPQSIRLASDIFVVRFSCDRPNGFRLCLAGQRVYASPHSGYTKPNTTNIVFTL